MEVCEKTPADRKGGHPAVLKETGLLVLRETAQTPEEDLEKFGDIDTWKYFNTNNLWVNLRALAKVLDEQRRRARAADDRQQEDRRPRRQVDARGLPARDRDGRGGRRLRGRARRWSCRGARFAPVKTTSDLLVLRSDAYVLTDDFRVEPSPDLPRRPAAGRARLRPLQAPARLRRALPGRPAVAGGREEAGGRGRREVRPRRRRARRGEVSNDGDEQLVIDDGAVLEG